MNATPPSRWRIPATVVLGICAWPLALPAWILLSGSGRAVYWSSRWVRWAAWIFVATTLPLLVVGLAGESNPIGLGLLFVAGSAVASVMALVGVLTAHREA
ncbi:MAG: hypothetical protein FJ197_13350 [Gammaproteobacteria bacterium]|nr:hypothetical protein [Gammaproteobacteria bacterium]